MLSHLNILCTSSVTYRMLSISSHVGVTNF